MKMAAEKNFENQLKDWLQSIGIYPLGCSVMDMKVPPVGYYEKRWGGGYQKAGLPDMHIVAAGINVDVELKAPKGKPSELQIHDLKQINGCGSIGVLLYPDGFEEFKILLKGVMQQCNQVIPWLDALKIVHTGTSCDILTG